MKKSIYIFLYIIGVLLFIEGVLRFCYPLPELSNFNRITYQIMAHEKVNAPYLRNMQMIWKSYPDTVYDFIHQTNTYGFRDTEWEVKKSADKTRYLFLGDSFVEGMMSTQEKTIPQVFQKLAKRDGKNIECFNAGMMGIGMNEYMKFVRDALPIFKPDELILVLFANDAPFQREYQAGTAIEPQYHSFWKPRLLSVLNENKSDAPIPFRYKLEVRPFYKAVPDPSNPWTYKSEEIKNYVSKPIADAMKQGNFNFFRYNWILEEERFLKADIQVKEKLSFIQSICKQNNCELSIFYVPSRSQVTNYYYQYERSLCLTNCPDFVDLTGPQYQKHANQIANDCQALGIPFKDLSGEVRREEANGNHLYWNFDDHMRAKGYSFLAKQIYQHQSL